MARYAQKLKMLPVIAPVAFTTSPVASQYVDVGENHWATFLVSFGLMTSDSTDTVTLTVECSTAASSNANEVKLAYKYRLSAAVGTDSMGAITAATSDGMSINAADDDSKMLVIDVDPATIPAKLTDGRFLRLVATPSAQMASGVISAVALLEPRYPGDVQPSAT